MLQLVLPEYRYLESVKAAISEYQDHPSPFDINCVDKLIKAAENNFQTYFSDVENDRNAVNLPSGHVPSTTLWLLNNEAYIGSLDIRHYLNDFLQKRGGHIAYQIIPSQRRRGFAQAGLKLALHYCRDVLKLEKVLLTCRFENQDSYQTMTAVMKEYGGHEDEPSESDGHKEHRIWIVTPCSEENC